MNAVTIGGFGENGQSQTMSSREIAELCEARHNDVVATIVRLFDQGVLRESRKTTRPLSPQGGGRPTQVYDLTKRDTLVVVSGYSAELRARIIDRWQELETATAINPANLSRMQLIQIAMEAETELQQERERVVLLEHKVEEDAPKAEFYDRFADADGLYGLQNAGRVLHQPPNKFVRWLKQDYLFYQGGALVPRAPYVKSGLFEVKSELVDDKPRHRTWMTPKGVQYFAKKLGVEATAH